MEFKLQGKLVLPLLFFLFVAAYGVFFHITNPAFAPASSSEEAIKEDCALEYGENECVEGKLSIPFYNNGTKTISSTEITIPTIRGVDIAGVQGILVPKQAGAIEATDCMDVDYSRNMKVKWCCEKCYEAEMTSPTDAVKLKRSAS